MGSTLTGAWAILLLGCAPKTPSAPQTFSWEAPSAVVVTVAQGEPVAPGRWSSGTLTAVVPPGWVGETGPPDSALALRVTEPTTATTVEVWRYPLSGRPQPRPRPGCTPLFDDPGRFRAIPMLGQSATHSCILDDGTLAQGWYGVVAGEEVHVEVLYPPGQGFRGRERVDPFLRGLASTPRQ